MIDNTKKINDAYIEKSLVHKGDKTEILKSLAHDLDFHDIEVENAKKLNKKSLKNIFKSSALICACGIGAVIGGQELMEAIHQPISTVVLEKIALSGFLTAASTVGGIAGIISLTNNIKEKKQNDAIIKKGEEKISLIVKQLKIYFEAQSLKHTFMRD